jgi:hypothetical protein
VTEHWRPVPDWEGLYSVSNYGRIRSEPRNAYRVNTARGYTVRGRVLKPNAAGGVNLSRPGARASVKCRRMAAYVFGCTPTKGSQYDAA